MKKTLQGKACVPDGSAIYAIGDLHGCFSQLEDIISLIGEDAAKSEARRKVAVFLGDYVDRGPESSKVLEKLATWDIPGVEGIFLKGNHEEMMLDSLAKKQNRRTRKMLELWLNNGGEATLKSYGAESCQELAETLPSEHRKFLEGLRLHHREGDYLFVHAGLRPGVQFKDQDPHDLTWIRAPFLEHEGDYEYCVVHGHTPVIAPQDHGSRIAIDTGACFTGTLTALALEGTRRRFLQVQA